jgi:hypothetical protein
MNDGIVVLEGPEFAAEQARLMVDNGIIDMAGGLYYDANAPKGQALLDWLESWEGISMASRVAGDRGIKAMSIGGPARAIRALVVITMNEEAGR